MDMMRGLNPDPPGSDLWVNIRICRKSEMTLAEQNYFIDERQSAS